MPTPASSAGFSSGIRSGLEDARRRRLEAQQRSQELAQQQREEARAAERHRSTLADFRRRGEREEFDLERSRIGAKREDESFERTREQMAQEGLPQVFAGLREGVDPDLLMQKFNTLGAKRLRRIDYDDARGMVRLEDDEGEIEEHALEDWMRAYPMPAREPIKLDKDDRLLEPGTYRELVGTADSGEAMDQRERKIRALTDRGIARTRAEDIADRNVDIQIVPQTGTARLIDRVNNTVEEIPLGVLGQEGGERAAPAEGRTLWDLAEHATGPVSAVTQGTSVVSGMVGGPVAEETAQARQMLRLETQSLIRSLAVNPRFPVAEMERLREEIALQPAIFDNPQLMRQRMIAIDEGLRRRLAQAERDADDPNLPRDTRASQAQNASAIQNFLPTLGVPSDVATGTGGTDVESLPGFDELTPEEQAELRELARGN